MEKLRIAPFATPPGNSGAVNVPRRVALAGAAVGLMVAGPFGAAVGGAVGWLVGANTTRSYNIPANSGKVIGVEPTMTVTWAVFGHPVNSRAVRYGGGG